ncbi:MAG: hypothetical protein IRY99_24625 [Isosphaeraceae bacterium]|nr:hypothetical protein [Isosphaeraceae bacterium]
MHASNISPATAGNPAGVLESGAGIRPMILGPSEVASSSTPLSNITTSGSRILMQGSSGGGSNPPQLQVRLLGPGLHTYDPPGTSIPNVIQGSSYSGASGGGAALYDISTSPPTRLDDGTTDWQLQNYTWTFPAGAVKGWGKFTQFSERPGDPQGDFWVFSGDPDPETASTSYGRVAPFTSDDLEKAPPIESNDHVIDTFYWGPTATGVQTVSITATFVDNATLQTFTGSDSVTFNVVQPAGSISLTAPFGTAGTSTMGADGNQWLQLDVNTLRATFGIPAGSPVGIAWQASITPSIAPIGALSGDFAICQTMSYTAHRRYTGWPSGTIYTETDGLLPGKVNPGTVLDALWYPGTFGGANLSARLARIQWIRIQFNQMIPLGRRLR